MFPNRFPDEGQAPEYNTVDATLWYFEAIRAYHEATLSSAQGRPGDDVLLRDLFPVLQDIVDWHVRGTRYQIHVDPADGLLYAGEPGVQLSTPLRSGTPFGRLDGRHRSPFGRQYSARWTTGW